MYWWIILASVYFIAIACATEPECRNVCRPDMGEKCERICKEPIEWK